MPTTILTTDDLREFKIELIEELKELMKNQSSHQQAKWLKSYEVRKLLNLSHGTLQTLRDNGTIPYTRIGGILLYNAEEIHKLLLSNKIKN